jgi:PAS domain-containing protein
MPTAHPAHLQPPAGFIHRTQLQEDHAVLVLDEEGRIRDCNSSAEQLFGFPQEELLTKHISVLIPQLGGSDLQHNGDINPRIKLLSRIGWLFRARHGAKGMFRCRLFLSCPGDSRSRQLRLIVREDA